MRPDIIIIFSNILFSNIITNIQKKIFLLNFACLPCEIIRNYTLHRRQKISPYELISSNLKKYIIIFIDFKKSRWMRIVYFGFSSLQWKLEPYQAFKNLIKHFFKNSLFFSWWFLIFMVWMLHIGKNGEKVKNKRYYYCRSYCLLKNSTESWLSALIITFRFYNKSKRSSSSRAWSITAHYNCLCFDDFNIFWHLTIFPYLRSAIRSHKILNSFIAVFWDSLSFSCDSYILSTNILHQLFRLITSFCWLYPKYYLNF